MGPQYQVRRAPHSHAACHLRPCDVRDKNTFASMHTSRGLTAGAAHRMHCALVSRFAIVLFCFCCEVPSRELGAAWVFNVSVSQSALRAEKHIVYGALLEGNGDGDGDRASDMQDQCM